MIRKMLPYLSSYSFNTQNHFMKLICIVAMALLCYSCQRKTVGSATVTKYTYTDAGGNQVLLGIRQKEDLLQAPYKDWFDKNYSDYKIDTVTATLLKPYIKTKQFEIFMGTWCGDSRREIPRIYKILESAGAEPAQIKLVMVDNRDGTYKQSPGHEEKGKSIHRVPDLIVYNNKKEMNRIVEYPVISLEKDLLAILREDRYQPNYQAAAYLLQLVKEKTVTAITEDTIQLTEKLKNMVKNSAELNSLGYVWMAANENDKALLALQLNAALFPNDANVYDSLAEMNLKLNNKIAARKLYEKVLLLKPGHTNAIKMLEQLR
jgi:tetratricopeptide (TPR) repeat protein